MALRFADRVKDTASAVSGSTVTLSNSPGTGFQSFNSGIGDGNICVYCIFDTAGNWEISYGAYTNSGATLARASTPIASSNAGAQVASFSGTISVFCTDPAANAAIPQKGLASGRLYTNFGGGTGGTGVSTSTGLIRYLPVYIDQWFSSATLYVNLSAAFAGTATFGLALYTNANGGPDKKLASTTGLNCGTGAGTGASTPNSGSLTMPSPQPPGLYWVAFLGATNAATFIHSTASAGGGVNQARNAMGIATIATTDINAILVGWNETNSSFPATATPAAVISTGPAVGVAAVL